MGFHFNVMVRGRNLSFDRPLRSGLRSKRTARCNSRYSRHSGNFSIEGATLWRGLSRDREFARASRIRVIDLKHEGCAHLRCKNNPLISLRHLLNWPPLTLMFLGPKVFLNTKHVHSFSKKPWWWINAKVEISVLRCGQVDLFLSFQVRFEC